MQSGSNLIPSKEVIAIKVNISVEEAQGILLSRVSPLSGEKISLDSAQDRILANDIYAAKDLPHFFRVMMDGYALRSIDANRKSIKSFRVIGELPAGQASKQSVRPGTCIIVMTGSPLPKGADAVIRQEEVNILENQVVIYNNIKPGSNIDPPGTDIKAGTKAIVAGTSIGAGETALLAALGYSKAEVYRMPRVAVLTTGDELIEITEKLRPGKIRDSNRYMLMSACRDTKADAAFWGSLPDMLEATKKALLMAGEESDLVISTGGVSVGNYDLVRKALLEIADETLFWRVKMKPGMPVIAVTRKNKLYFGLSGKPTGSLLNFELLVKPVLRKMMGCPIFYPPTVEAYLQVAFNKVSNNCDRFLWSKATYCREWQVTPAAKGTFSELLGFNALAVVPSGCKQLAKGDRVKTILTKSMF